MTSEIKLKDINELLFQMDFELLRTKTHFRLKDLMGANLGGICNEIYEIENPYITLTFIVDLMSRYINNYFVVDMLELLWIEDVIWYSYGDYYRLAKRLKDKKDRQFYRRLFKSLAYPERYFYINQE